jgi:CRISPR-associated Cas5-like protein
MRTYTVSLDVAGPAAIFTRPDSGASFLSYPAPTYSALKAIFECVPCDPSGFSHISYQIGDRAAAGRTLQQNISGLRVAH